MMRVGLLLGVILTICGGVLAAAPTTQQIQNAIDQAKRSYDNANARLGTAAAAADNAFNSIDYWNAQGDYAVRAYNAAAANVNNATAAFAQVRDASAAAIQDADRADKGIKELQKLMPNEQAKLNAANADVARMHTKLAQQFRGSLEYQNAVAAVDSSQSNLDEETRLVIADLEDRSEFQQLEDLAGAAQADVQKVRGTYPLNQTALAAASKVWIEAQGNLSRARSEEIDVDFFVGLVRKQLADAQRALAMLEQKFEGAVAADPQLREAMKIADAEKINLQRLNDRMADLKKEQDTAKAKAAQMQPALAAATDQLTKAQAALDTAKRSYDYAVGQSQQANYDSQIAAGAQLQAEGDLALAQNWLNSLAQAYPNQFYGVGGSTGGGSGTPTTQPTGQPTAGGSTPPPPPATQPVVITQATVPPRRGQPQHAPIPPNHGRVIDTGAVTPVASAQASSDPANTSGDSVADASTQRPPVTGGPQGPRETPQTFTTNHSTARQQTVEQATEQSQQRRNTVDQQAAAAEARRAAVSAGPTTRGSN